MRDHPPFDALCHNPKCKVRVYTATNPRQLYCSQKCSAQVRQHDYCERPKGRMKKRELASRYFQRHRFEIYEKRAARFARYVSEELHKVDKWAALLNHGAAFCQSRADGSPRYDTDGLCLLEAKRKVRLRHDYHPDPWDTRYGSQRWEGRHTFRRSERQNFNAAWDDWSAWTAYEPKATAACVERQKSEAA